MKNSFFKMFYARYLIIGLFLTMLAFKSNSQSNLTPEDWKIAVEAWTFRNFTLMETLDKLDSLGVKYLGGHPDQVVGNGIKGKMNYFEMDLDDCRKIAEILKNRGIKMVSYGVITPDTKIGWVQLFEFAKALDIPMLGVEPRPGQMDLVSKLADEYGIEVAIHNHPKPTLYWNPQIFLKAVEDQSYRIGALADIGHWVRSGLDPIDCMKNLEGYIKEFHMKDLNEFGIRNAHDVPWGTGVSNIEGIMEEMKRQDFKGYISVEYEYHWDNSLPEVRESLDFFRKTANRILKK